MDYLPGNTPGVIKSSVKAGGKTPISIPRAAVVKRGPEYNIWFWHPNRCDVRFAPDWFRSQVKSIDPDLEVTWTPIAERWLVWIRSAKINNPICQGWRLLFVHHDEDRNHLPLDERLLARLFLIDSTRNGGSKRYFDRIISEFERDRTKKREHLRQDAIDRAMPFWDHSQIKNIGQGNKFSTYFA